MFAEMSNKEVSQWQAYFFLFLNKEQLMAPTDETFAEADPKTLADKDAKRLKMLKERRGDS